MELLAIRCTYGDGGALHRRVCAHVKTWRLWAHEAYGQHPTRLDEQRLRKYVHGRTVCKVG